MKWKVFYTDGGSFSNEDGEPEDAPGWDVLAIVQESESVGVEVHFSKDFYVFDQRYGGWYNIDYFGLTTYIAKPGKKIIKLGESMSTDRYLKMIDEIRRDPNLPRKSARYSWERKFNG